MVRSATRQRKRRNPPMMMLRAILIWWFGVITAHLAYVLWPLMIVLYRAFFLVPRFGVRRRRWTMIVFLRHKQKRCCVVCSCRVWGEEALGLLFRTSCLAGRVVAGSPWFSSSFFVSIYRLLILLLIMILIFRKHPYSSIQKSIQSRKFFILVDTV